MDSSGQIKMNWKMALMFGVGIGFALLFYIESTILQPLQPEGLSRLLRSGS